MNITDLFVSEVITFSKREFPEGIVHQVKRCVLDYLGVTYAGANEVKEKINIYLDSCSTQGKCSAIGLGKTIDIQTAGLVNGFTSHVIELDDGHRFGMLHLEAPIISAMIAVAQHENLTVEQFFKGVITGYEAAIRLAMVIQPAHKQRGFHATGTCGTIGVACAVAVSLGLDEDQLKNVVSAAATSAAGLLEVIDDASQLKPYNVAKAVENGITAVYIGRAGFIGPEDALGGKRGFFNALTGSFDDKAICGNENGEYAIEKIYVKPYAACRHCHGAIEGALNINQREKIKWQDIENIEVETYKLAVLGHDHTNIMGVSSAKMSIPYGVAASIILNKAGVNAFKEDVVMRPDILSLCNKVIVTENAELTDKSPEKRGAIVKIYMKKGIIYEEKVEYPLGEPENRISDQQLEEKYKSLMELSGVQVEKVNEISKMVWNLEDCLKKLLEII